MNTHMRRRNMKNIKVNGLRTSISLAVLLALCMSIVPLRSASAGPEQGQSRSSKVSEDLRAEGEDLVRVLLQLRGKPGGPLNSLLNRNGVHIRAHFKSFNTYVVELPARMVTACTFGGEGLDELFITTSREGLEPGDDPLAGALFRAVPGVSGLPIRAFAG